MTRDDLGGVDAYDIEVGLTVRHFRSTRRVSQADFAAALGVSFQQVRRFERGAERMSAANLVRAAERLKVAPADLLPQIDATPSLSRAEGSARSDAQAPGAWGSRVNSPRHRVALLALIQALQP